MTIGNLPKKVCYTYSHHTYVLVAYFPILEPIGRESAKPAFIQAKRVLYQKTMHMILNHITKATTEYEYLLYTLIISYIKVIISDIFILHTEGCSGRIQQAIPINAFL